MNYSSLSHKEFVAASFSLVFTWLVLLIAYADLPRRANAGETAKSAAANIANRPKNRLGSCCSDDEGTGKQHLLAGSYYSVKDNLSAKLLLNNKGPDPIHVQPTLFSLGGERFDLPSLTVDPNSHRFEDFGAWVAIAGDQFQEGSIQILHRGEDLVLGAQIYLTDEEHSLSFDEKLSELGSSGPSRLEGVWWLPSTKGAVNLVLSNTTGDMLSVSTTIRGSDPQRGVATTVNVAAHETQILNIERDLLGRETGAMSTFGAISINHNGGPSALLARAMAWDRSLGYSLPIQFADPMKAKSNNVQGAGLRSVKMGSTRYRQRSLYTTQEQRRPPLAVACRTPPATEQTEK